MRPSGKLYRLPGGDSLRFGECRRPSEACGSKAWGIGFSVVFWSFKLGGLETSIQGLEGFGFGVQQLRALSVQDQLASMADRQQHQADYGLRGGA